MDSAVLADARGIATPLVCPGARGCETAGGDVLRVGAAARVITPDFDNGPVYLAGFDIGRQATGVHDDIEVRAIVLERGELRVGLVVAAPRCHDAVPGQHGERRTLGGPVAAHKHAPGRIGHDLARHLHATGDDQGFGFAA
jgi:hypothetical protein